MRGKFVTAADVEREQLDWGELGWICRPPLTGASDVCVIEVILNSGGGHDFHKHPDQEEVITVISGEIVQWLEQEKQILGPGDSIFIDADIVHASFNEGDVPAKLMVTLGPCVGDGGYEVVEVADQAPWNSLR
jgi:quercetin dioxygenase-like cupin family protein